MILAAVLGTSRHPKWKFRELLKENNCFSCSSSSYFPISRATSSENMRLCSHFRASCWELQDQQKSAHTDAVDFWSFQWACHLGSTAQRRIKLIKKSNYLNKDSNQRTFFKESDHFKSLRSTNFAAVDVWEQLQVCEGWSCGSVGDSSAHTDISKNLWLHTGLSGLGIGIGIGYWLKIKS